MRTFKQKVRIVNQTGARYVSKERAVEVPVVCVHYHRREAPVEVKESNGERYVLRKEGEV